MLKPETAPRTEAEAEVARRVAGLARYTSGPYVMQVPARLIAPMKRRAWTRLTDAERTAIIRRYMEVEVATTRAEVNAKRAARRAAKLAGTTDHASATGSSSSGDQDAARADASTARFWVGCACNCGAMLETSSPKPVTRYAIGCERAVTRRDRDARRTVDERATR